MLQVSKGMLATNISGSFSMTELSLPPPVTMIGAQFMYISRLPTLLNHVHARVYCPFGMPLGIVNWKTAAPSPSALGLRFPVTFEGQPPIMLWITFHWLFFVGFWSKVTLT